MKEPNGTFVPLGWLRQRIYGTVDFNPAMFRSAYLPPFEHVAMRTCCCTRFRFGVSLVSTAAPDGCICSP